MVECIGRSLACGNNRCRDTQDSEGNLLHASPPARLTDSLAWCRAGTSERRVAAWHDRYAPNRKIAYKDCVQSFRKTRARFHEATSLPGSTSNRQFIRWTITYPEPAGLADKSKLALSRAHCPYTARQSMLSRFTSIVSRGLMSTSDRSIANLAEPNIRLVPRMPVVHGVVLCLCRILAYVWAGRCLKTARMTLIR